MRVLGNSSFPNLKAERDMSVFSLIPARGGSRRILRKNLVNLGGFPLLAFSVAASKATPLIDRTIVSTDDEEIASIAEKFGAEVPFRRPAESSQHFSPDIDYVLHTLENLLQSGQLPELLVLLRPTTPFREPALIADAIQRLQNSPGATSLRSAHSSSESPFKWFRLSKEGFFHGIIDGLSNEEINMPNQSFPQVFIPNGYVDIVRPSWVLENRQLFGEKMLGFPTPIAYELDRPEDLELLEFVRPKQGSHLLSALSRWEAEKL